MRHIILHYHIFKNAGSTLAAALDRNFGNNFALLHSSRYDQPISDGELLGFVDAHPRVLAISSHHLRPPAPQLAGVQFHEVLILREPLDRIRSMYDFYRRAKVNEDPLTRVAKQFNVRDFLQYVLDNCKHLVTNAQTNVIANRGGKFPDQDDQNRAALMLHSTAVVGVVDMFEACVLQAEHSLASAFPGLDLSYVRENVTPARASDMEIRSREFASACGEDLHRQLTSLNQLDSELVAFARAESLRRWERIAGRNAKLRKLRRRVLYRNITHTVADQNLRVQRLCRRAMQLLLPTSS